MGQRESRQHDGKAGCWNQQSVANSGPQLHQGRQRCHQREQPGECGDDFLPVARKIQAWREETAKSIVSTADLTLCDHV